MRRAAATVMTVLAVAAAWGAEPSGTPASREALALCHRAAGRPPAERADLLARSLAAADAAVAANDRDALAHFARFCALGEQAQLAGAGITSLVKARAMRGAVDRTLALAPEFPDALLGKGALLLGLPRLLGGDPDEGERLVRRALAVDPDYLGARFALVKALRARGADEEADAEAARAVAVAERKGDPADVAEARALLGEPPR